MAPELPPDAVENVDPVPSAQSDLDVTGCPGGVVVDWSPAGQPEVHHYTALRSIEPDVNPAYPPIAPAVACTRA